jgi:hypothetical protein
MASRAGRRARLGVAGADAAAVDAHLERRSGAPITRIQLRIEKICVNGHCYLAIKAEGVEIETLRRVAGFEEA